MGHVCRSAGELYPILLSLGGGRDGFQAAVRKCVGKASRRRPALIAAGRTKSCCRRGSVRAVATKRSTNSAPGRGHALYHDGQWFHVYCFSEPADARKFLERFGGEKFDPSERGRGANWAQWRKR